MRVLTVSLARATAPLMLLSAVAFIQEKRLFSSAPKEAQAVIQPRDEELFYGARIIGWTLMAFSLLMILGVGVISIWDGFRIGFTFWQFFLRSFTIGAVIKAFDILALDWFLLTKTHFFQHYFPETEGCAGWHDFGYNRRQQARQCVMIVLGSAVTAWIFTLL